MITFTYRAQRDGVTVLHGEDSTGRHDSAQQFAAWYAERPLPQPADQILVWAGEAGDREPDACVSRPVWLVTS
ncbi:hypothetical protein AB0F72_08745 [Actinoplanes sp. NPDC023936]|uniref:hypothetical protein n=1 Tax=Actinoplanes sp. NPDC023936 TaxID=3154910 RepID=UPI00340C4096